MTGPSGDLSVERSPWEQKDDQRRNYTVLPLCPGPVVAVTNANMLVLAQRRLMASLFDLLISISASSSLGIIKVGLVGLEFHLKGRVE